MAVVQECVPSKSRSKVSLMLISFAFELSQKKAEHASQMAKKNFRRMDVDDVWQPVYILLDLKHKY